jgi:hypothetical protein
VADHLLDAGEEKWLEGRAHVIAFEECWPIFAETGIVRPDPVPLLLRVAESVKAKDAAGLGFIAYALSRGEKVPGLPVEEEKAARVVGSALLRPADFWAWARRTAKEARARDVVLAAQASYRHAGWAWDKTIVLAAAYLAASEGVPEVRPSLRPPLPCPLWVGIDKHTEAGREALARVAKRVRLPARTLGILSFYREGALCNEAAPSPWWEREVERQLGKIKMTPGEAENAWRKVRPLLELAIDGAAGQTSACRALKESIP